MPFARWFRYLQARLTGRRLRVSASTHPLRPASATRLLLRTLEDRTLLNGHSLSTAALLPFANNVAHASGFLQRTSEVDLFKVRLIRGDRVTMAVNAQSIGSGLDAALRVFDANGKAIASNNDYHGLDPQLTFQASMDGSYYVGVSGFANPYDPANPPARPAGGSTGLYDLAVNKAPGSPAPDLEGASFQVAPAAAVWGDQLTVHFTVENRGGADTAGGFPVQVLLSTSSLFNTGSELVLAPVTAPALPAGVSFSPAGGLTITLPASAPAGFANASQVFVGLHIGSGTYTTSPEHGNDWEAVPLLTAQQASEPNDIIGTANLLGLNTRAAGSLSPGDPVDFFQLSAAQDGLLTAAVHADGGLVTRLSLYDSSGRVLIQSDGQSPASPDGLIVQHVVGGGSGTPTTYYLEVRRTAGAGGYALTTEFQPSLQPFVPMPVGVQASALVAGDFNGDGHVDLAFAGVYSPSAPGTVTVLLGNGDGSFSTGQTIPVGKRPVALVEGDFNGDGRPDLAVANFGSNTVTILLGQGDGSFQTAETIAVGKGPRALVAGDFSGDGRTDLAVARYDGTVMVLLGQGDGSFLIGQSIPVGKVPKALVSGDFNGDGRTDLAVANFGDNTVSVLLGNGNGTFRNAGPIAVGQGPDALVAGDFNGDGRTDLAIANSLDNTVSVLLANGGGSFQTVETVAVGANPTALVSGDFNGDGRTDLAVASFGRDTVTVLLGQDGGFFSKAGTVAVGSGPDALAAVDFNGDHRTDLAVATVLDLAVMVLPGQGDGSFSTSESAVAVGRFPKALVAADFNGDGKTDLAVLDSNAETVTVLLSQGDGSFRTAETIPVGFGPVTLVSGDFNGDGRIDLAVLDDGAHPAVRILLGNGDGSFVVEPAFAVGPGPAALAAGDFNGDGRTDLAVAYSGGTVGVLLANGDGSLRAAGPSIPVAANPNALVAGDFSGDGHTDLVVTSISFPYQTATMLLGDGTGSFVPGPAVQFGPGLLSLPPVAGDFTGDGRTKLAVVNFNFTYFGYVATVLQGHGDGSFSTIAGTPLGFFPSGLVAGDFNGDGRTDLAFAYVGFPDGLTVLLSQGDGTFSALPSVTLDFGSLSLVRGDFNGDGRTDLAAADTIHDRVGVLIGIGSGGFLPAGLLAKPTRSVPLVDDLNGDGTPDVAVLGDNGKILVRLGRKGQAGVFGPPITLNPGNEPDAHDIAIVHTPTRTFVAAADQDSSVSLYWLNPDGTVGRAALPGPDPAAPLVRIASGNLEQRYPGGKPIDDLVLATQGANAQVFVYLQNSAGGFQAAPDFTMPIGPNPSSITVADMNGDGLPEILITDRFSGTVTVLLNDPAKPFSSEVQYRAGTGPYWLANANGQPAVQSEEGSSAAAVGLFDSTTAALVVANPGTNHLALLRPTGAGRFSNPEDVDLPDGLHQASAVVAGDFNGDGIPDLAVLNEGTGTVSVFLGDGAGGFTLASEMLAGNDPVGLAAADLTGARDAWGNPILDLVVSNRNGDLLIFAGNGDGTFRPYQRAERTVGIAVADLTGTGRADTIIADEASDLVKIIDPSAPNAPLLFKAADGISAPSAVAVADLNGDGIPDLVVADSGSNQIQVFLGTGNGKFAAPQSFAVGTTPAGITIADLNGDGIPDLVVADQGSNDVKVLFGQGFGSDWTLVPGPRLAAGFGPVATVVQNVNGPGGTIIPEILVSNSQSNSVSLLRGIGNGFFDDRHPAVLPVGQDPGPIFLDHFGPGPGPQLVTVNAGSNDLTYFFEQVGGPVVALPTGGLRPVAAFTADLFHNGFTDLAVLNQGAGGVPPSIAVFAGTPFGLRLVEFVPLTNVAEPTGFAVTFQGGTFGVLVAGAGQDAAVAIALGQAVNAFSTSSALTVAFPTSSSGAGAEPGIISLPVAAGLPVSIAATATGINVSGSPGTAAEAGGTLGLDAVRVPEISADSLGSALAVRGGTDLEPGAETAGGLLTGTRPAARLASPEDPSLGAVPIYSTTRDETGTPTETTEGDEPGPVTTIFGLTYRSRTRPPTPQKNPANTPGTPKVTPVSRLIEQVGWEGVLAAAGIANYPQWMNLVSRALVEGRPRAARPSLK